MLIHPNILTERVLDNWDFNLFDNLLHENQATDEHLMLIYKLGKYNNLLVNSNYMRRLSVCLKTNILELENFMNTCIKSNHINENFLTGQHKFSYINFLSSNFYNINLKDMRLFLKILHEVRDSNDFICQSFFLKNVIDYSYANSNNFLFKDGIYFIILEIIYKNLLNTLGGKLYYDKLRVIARKYYDQKKSYSGNKIALCLCGVLRPGWRDNIKALINSFSMLGEIDVFIYSWDMESLWPGVGGNGIGWIRRFFHPIVNQCPSELIMSNTEFSQKFPNVFNILSTELIKKVSIKDVFVLDDRIKKVALESYPRIENCLGELKNDSKIYYGIYQVYKNMEEYERQNNFKYDFVIRMRTDFSIVNNDITMEDLHLLELNEVYSARYYFGIDGSLEIGRRCAMENYMKTWLHIKENQSNPIFASCFKYFPMTCMSPGNGFLSHYILSQWFDFLKLRVVKMNISFSYISDFLFHNICFPDVRSELDKDIKHIKEKKVYTEEQIEKIISFFNLITQKCRIIKRPK
ncbi:sugar transferase, partial [Campylobacter coli]|nr:sugar transferase [Campylobacter coli]